MVEPFSAGSASQHNLSFIRTNTVERTLVITSHTVAHVGFLAATSVASIMSFNAKGHLKVAIF